MQLRIAGPKHQFLCLRQVKAVQWRDGPGQAGKDSRRRHAADAAQRRAQRLAAEAGEQEKGRRCGQRHHADGDQNRVRPPENQGNQQIPQAGQRIGQAQQRHGPLLPPDEDEQRSKHHQQSSQHESPVIIGHRDDVGLPVIVVVQAHHDARPQAAVHVGIGVEIVGGLQDRTFERAGEQLHLDVLFPQPSALGPGVLRTVVRQHIRNPGNGKQAFPGGPRLPFAFTAPQSCGRDDQHRQQEQGCTDLPDTPPLQRLYHRLFLPL